MWDLPSENLQAIRSNAIIPSIHNNYLPSVKKLDNAISESAAKIGNLTDNLTWYNHTTWSDVLHTSFMITYILIQSTETMDVVSHGSSKHRDDHSQANHGVANKHYCENTLPDHLRQNTLTYKLSEIKRWFISCDMPQIYQTNFLTNVSKSKFIQL